MANLQLSGLASGFDWKSLVDQLMEVERAPITRIEKEQLTNSQRSTALGGVGTKLSALKSAATGLSDSTLFSKRNASSTTSGSTWAASATVGMAPGSHKIAVSQLATYARREGVSNISSGINDTNDVSGLTVADLATATAVSAGTFSVNGHKVTVALTDSLQDVFDAISTATGGDVTASYDSGTDKITLSGTGEVSLGASNDTSNFLRVMKLNNSGTNTATSYGSLGSLKTSVDLADSTLATAITAVDGSGDGSFTLNGVTIDYNVNNDSLSDVLKRINQSEAGVTASYDSINDRVVLSNNATGDLGIAVSEAAGGLLGALGLTSGATHVNGKNAIFAVDDGATLYSTSNTLDSSAHGISGLSVTVNSETTETIEVSADTDTMRSKINDFISAYNAVQSYIDDKSKITTSSGKVTTSVLSGNREVQDWARQLRTLAFGAVSGLSGAITRLENIGIDFSGSGGVLAIEDEEKLAAALRDNPLAVEDLFQLDGNGLAVKFGDLLDTYDTAIDGQQENINKTNSDLDKQIEDIERRLAQQREVMTSSFIAMETAQSRIQQQGSTLTNAFFSSSSKK